MPAEFEAQCEEVLRRCAAKTLADERAMLHHHKSEHGDWFELAPARPDACQLSVTPGGPGEGELSLGVGRNGAWFEAWGSADETLAFLAKVVEAVLGGRYEEYVHGRRVVGRLALNARPFVFSNKATFFARWSAVRWPPRFGRWRHEAYAPF